MDPYDVLRTEAVWRRVRGEETSSFGEMALWEEALAGLCRSLHRQKKQPQLMERLYREARARGASLRALAKLAGEQSQEQRLAAPTPSPTELVERLGEQARCYDPAHPAYGPLFGTFRQECVRGQRQVLEKLVTPGQKSNG